MRNLILTITLSFSLPAVAQQLMERNPKAKRLLTVNQEFARLFRLYQKDALKPRALWKKLGQLSRYPSLSPAYKVTLMQMQADLLIESELPVTAAVYSTMALRAANDPVADSMKSSWHILHKVSKLRPIQYLLENLAFNLKLGGRLPPAFGNDWHYIIGNALVTKGDEEKAKLFYKRVNQSSRYYMPSRYQIAMIDYNGKSYKSAMAALKSVMASSTRYHSPLSGSDKDEMWNYANMAIGRIYYEAKEFITSARYFRNVHKTSPLYYDALFEQSWALFMSGNPKHSLGTLYGAASPFFNEIHNPEAKLLESIVYFWMCRYDDSRNSLADFAQKYSESVEGLSDFIDRNQFNSNSAYRLFENLVSGVTSQSLGIPRAVLNSAATRDTMLLVRDQLATIMSESDRLKTFGVAGTKYYTSESLDKVNAIKKSLRQALGEKFIEELKQERAHYEQLYAQAQFLYLELIMSEKEQLLGRELHASGKVSQVSDYDDIRGWGRQTQSWKGERKGEFWWDEIGFHIVNAEPKCVDKQ